MNDMGTASRGWGWMLGLTAGVLLVALGEPRAQTQPTTATGSLDSVLVVPNPYVVSGRTIGPYSALKQYEAIDFYNVPDPCTISVYTSAGNLVVTLQSKGGHFCQWSGRNADNQYVVSDVYIYVVQAPGLGTKIGKFMVIR